jgi:hypothetical protein
MGEPDTKELGKQVLKLAEQVQQSVLHLNNLVALSEFAEHDNDLLQITAIRALYRTFEHLLRNKPEYISSFSVLPIDDQPLKKKPKTTQVSKQVLEFLHDKFVDYIEILLNHLRNPESPFQVRNQKKKYQKNSSRIENLNFLIGNSFQNSS